MMPLPTSAQGPKISTPLVTGSTMFKIRDSCQACALSKVKCNKEKPTCSRCARRGMACQYLVTKRPGRKRYSSSNIRPDLSEGQSSLPGTADLSRTPSRPSNVSGAECSSTMDMYSDALTPLEPSPTSTLQGMSSEFDQFYTSSIHNLFQFDELDTINLAQEYNDIEKLLMPDNVDFGLVSDTSSLDCPSASKASSPSSHGQSLSTSTSHTSVTDVIDSTDKSTGNSTCSCLMLALDFMRKLSTKPASCALTNIPDNATAMSNTSHSGNASAQIVVTENKQTIEAVSDILQCSCAEDAYLLTMLSMIVFKILGRYTAAARKQPGEAAEGRDRNTSTSTLNSYYPDGEDHGRIAAQLILSELHRVQRLVNQLSPRLKTRGMGAASEGGGISSAKDAGGDCKITSGGETTTAAFSATTLDQIEVDLRRCLSTLSLEIINMLRQS